MNKYLLSIILALTLTTPLIHADEVEVENPQCYPQTTFRPFRSSSFQSLWSYLEPFVDQCQLLSDLALSVNLDAINFVIDNWNPNNAEIFECVDQAIFLLLMKMISIQL